MLPLSPKDSTLFLIVDQDLEAAFGRKFIECLRQIYLKEPTSGNFFFDFIHFHNDASEL